MIFFFKFHTHLLACAHIWNFLCPSHRMTSHVPYVNESCPIHEGGMSHIWMSHVPHTEWWAITRRTRQYIWVFFFLSHRMMSDHEVQMVKDNTTDPFFFLCLFLFLFLFLFLLFFFLFNSQNDVRSRSAKRKGHQVWVIFHIWISWHRLFKTICLSHVPYMNETCFIYELGMSHIWMSHVSRMNKLTQNVQDNLSKSCPIHEWVMSHIWTRHVPHMNESCPTYE